MSEIQRQGFGKRRPQPPAPTTPLPKRSSHVALLLMGTFAVGGAAYTMIPRANCPPQPASGAVAPGIAAPAPPQPNPGAGCTSGSSGSTGSRSSRYFSFFNGGSSSSSSSSSSWHSSSSGSSSGSSSESSSGVSRGGFGSFGHAMGFSGS